MTARASTDFAACLHIISRDHRKFMERYSFPVSVEMQWREATNLHNAMGYRKDQPDY